jgi:hypothetical protein
MDSRRKRYDGRAGLLASPELQEGREIIINGVAEEIRAANHDLRSLGGVSVVVQRHIEALDPRFRNYDSPCSVYRQLDLEIFALGQAAKKRAL